MVRRGAVVWKRGWEWCGRKECCGTGGLKWCLGRRSAVVCEKERAIVCKGGCEICACCEKERLEVGGEEREWHKKRKQKKLLVILKSFLVSNHFLWCKEEISGKYYGVGQRCGDAWRCGRELW